MPAAIDAAASGIRADGAVQPVRPASRLRGVDMADGADELISELLTGTMEELDVPELVGTTMHAVYDDVGRWMSDTLGEGNWSIYSQGSGRLGTMVRPPDGGEFDIDSVAVQNVDKSETTRQGLKDDVGDVLDEFVKARATSPGPVPTACKESRRCWTLYFNEPFHMDVLPAIPDPEAPPTGIQLPDRELTYWQHSDPIGYSEWFFARMAEDVLSQREAFARKANVLVEDVPRWRLRMTLQRIVQVLKVHRDHYFEVDDPHRPPSILITTLAARAYRGEQQLVEGVMNAASRMSGLVDRDGDLYVVLNPVQPDENFADMWTPRAAIRFFEWMSDLQRILDEALETHTGLHEAASVLTRRFGAEAVLKSATRYGATRRTTREADNLRVATTGIIGATGLTVKQHTFHGD